MRFPGPSLHQGENQSDRDLNLESWRHIAGIGSQEHAVKAESETTVAFGLATLEEILWNQCNLSNNSHLVRDLTNDKVLGRPTTSPAARR